MLDMMVSKESTDLDQFVRHTHEFEFPIAAVRDPGGTSLYLFFPSPHVDNSDQESPRRILQFHHAHEAYLVPDLLKQAWPGNGTRTPAVALFATK